MPIDENLLPSEVEEARATKNIRSQRAAPRGDGPMQYDEHGQPIPRSGPVMVDAEQFAQVLARQRIVSEDDGRPLKEVVRTKIRCMKHQHGVDTMRFSRSEVIDPRDADRDFRFGDTVYLKREAFLVHKGSGMLMRGD